MKYIEYGAKPKPDLIGGNMEHWLDKYLYEKPLTDIETQIMWADPLKYCSLGLANTANYDYVWGHIAIINKSYFPMHLSIVKDVFYIIDKTKLSKWQKFKLKLAYLF
jgi:hypothetical protein